MTRTIKDLTMPTICLAIGIWAAFTYPSQLHMFYDSAKKYFLNTPAAAAAEQPPIIQTPPTPPTAAKPAIKTPPTTAVIATPSGKFVHGPINCIAKPGADTFWAAYMKDAGGSEPYWDYVRQEACA